MSKTRPPLMAAVMKRLRPQAIAASLSLNLLRRLLRWLQAMDLPIHDRTTITELCTQWLSADKSSEAGEFLLAPAAPAAFRILARSAAAGGSLKASTSQCGEDLIIHHIFTNRSIAKPTYLDIGAHHPLILSNTAIFYAAGCHGINVEPNPQLISEFHRLRPNDVNLQLAVSDSAGHVDLLVPSSSAALATICNDQIPAGEHSVFRVPSITLAELIDRYAQGRIPDLLSLDVEGHDLAVLKQLSDLKTLPKVICVETVSYSPTGHGSRQEHILDFLIEIGYQIYADTSINTIFVLKAFWGTAEAERSSR